MAIRTSNPILLGVKNVSHLVPAADLDSLPDDAVIIFETYISEDDGGTWRLHGGASVRAGDRIKGEPSGAGIVFEGGNQNDRFRIRTSVSIKDVPTDLMVVVDEVIDRAARIAPLV